MCSSRNSPLSRRNMILLAIGKKRDDRETPSRRKGNGMTTFHAASTELWKRGRADPTAAGRDSSAIRSVWDQPPPYVMPLLPWSKGPVGA